MCPRIPVFLLDQGDIDELTRRGRFSQGEKLETCNIHRQDQGDVSCPALLLLPATCYCPALLLLLSGAATATCCLLLNCSRKRVNQHFFKVRLFMQTLQTVSSFWVEVPGQVQHVTLLSLSVGQTIAQPQAAIPQLGTGSQGARIQPRPSVSPMSPPTSSHLPYHPPRVERRTALPQAL